MRYYIIFFICIGWLLGQQGPLLNLDVTPEKVNKTPQELSGGELTFSPGDTLRYIITASNVGDDEMREPTIVDPIPPGVVYVPQSVTGDPAVITFSLDQGNYFQEWPPVKLVTDENGEVVEKPAPVEDITHIRWEIQDILAPGESREVTFLAVIR